MTPAEDESAAVRGLSSVEIHAGWTVSLIDGRDVPDAVAASARSGIAATVPGQVHADLQREGLIPDPTIDDNERVVGWVGRSGWRYETTVERPQGQFDRLDLVFDGLDTVATLSIDGVQLGQTANMHRSYRFDVGDALAASGLLRVDFASAYDYTAELERRFGAPVGPYSEPFGLIRKMACSFGWDWGLTLVSAGIWRPVRLEAWSTARIASVRPLTSVSSDGGLLDLRVEIERARDTGLTAAVRVIGPGVELELDLEIAEDATSLQRLIELPGALAWWPRGYGEQPLYEVEVTLLDGTDRLDRSSSTVGFRSVEIETTPDERGSSFILSVNGTPVEVRGFNWIPDDILPSRMTGQRYRDRIATAVGVGANLLRVWGGGIYESREFYEACDEAGILVWQDFLFACSTYPEADPILAEVIAEAKENITRLSPHPSLVVWSGNNENLWLHDREGWAEEIAGRPWGSGYYLDLLPALVADRDPSRAYVAGSPWSGSTEIEPNSVDHGSHHSWDVWNALDFEHYRDSEPRFIAEYGWQSPPAWRTIRDAVSDSPMTPDSPGVLWHQKANDGQAKLARGIAAHFGTVPKDFDRWHFLAQLTQSRAITVAIEHWRANWPHTGGTILWQFNDLWPVSSWSALDSAGRLKPLMHELRRLFADRLVFLERVGDELLLGVSNATDAPWSLPVTVRRFDVGGAVLASVTLEVAVPPREVARIAVPAEVAARTTAREFIVADVGATVAQGESARAFWYDLPDADVEWQEPRYSVLLSEGDGGTEVTITAETLVRDLLLQADRAHPDAVASRGFVTLLPGESVRTLVGGAPISAEQLGEPFVLTDLASVLRTAD
jgi:beta-mannosidase